MVIKNKELIFGNFCSFLALFAVFWALSGWVALLVALTKWSQKELTEAVNLVRGGMERL